jgi:chemotaxis protein methyltransferase WspC
MSDSEPLHDWLARTIGLDAAALGPSLVERAVGRRMKALGQRDRDTYLKRVVQSLSERQELSEELVVTETWFFRDARPFQILGRFAREWAARANGDRLRILSVPCASGEEPYSIVITLLEAGLRPERFEVVGVDLSAQAIERAAQGRYGPRALRNIDAARRARYFRPENGRYELDPALRRAVRLEPGNLNDPGFLAGEAPFDVIFCRNVLIYFTEAARLRVIGHMRRLLKPAGLLFVGSAERSSLLDHCFVPVADPASFAYRLKPASTLEAGAGAARPAAGQRPGAPVPVSRPTPASRSPGRKPVEKGAPAPRGSPAQTSAPRAAEPDLEGQAAWLASRGRYAEAEALCHQAIRQSGPSAQAFHLLGMIAQARGADTEAERWLSKAVFLDRHHAESLLALSLLARKRGDLQSESRYRRLAERANKRTGP